MSGATWLLSEATSIWRMFLQHSGQEMAPGGSDGKESSCSAGDSGLISGFGRSPGKGNSYPLQCCCLDNSMDRGTWQATFPSLLDRNSVNGVLASAVLGLDVLGLPHPGRGDTHKPPLPPEAKPAVPTIPLAATWSPPRPA